MKWYEKVVQKYNVKINENMFDVVIEGLESNKEKYGMRYCPCKVQRIKENICPCKEMRENKICHCGLFVE